MPSRSGAWTFARCSYSATLEPKRRRNGRKNTQMAKWSFEYVVRLWTDGGFQAVADQHNREVKNEKSDSSHPVSNSDSVADHPADGAAHAETATVHPVHTGCELRGEGRALPTEQDTVNTLSGGAPMDVSQVDPMKSPPTQLRDYHDVPFPEGTQPNPEYYQLRKIAEKIVSRWSPALRRNIHKEEIDDITRALQEATDAALGQIKTAELNALRLGEEVAQLRQQLETTETELTYERGARENALLRLQQAEAKLDDNWSCKQKVIAQQTERIRELGKQLEAKEFELQQAWIIAREFGFRSKND